MSGSLRVDNAAIKPHESTLSVRESSFKTSSMGNIINSKKILKQKII